MVGTLVVDTIALGLRVQLSLEMLGTEAVDTIVFKET